MQITLQHIIHIIFSLLAISAVSLAAAGCSHGSKTESQADTSGVGETEEEASGLPETVKKLVRAVADNDSGTFAKIVTYPLQRPYPLHDIDSEDEMRAYYKEMVDDSLRHAIASAGPDRWTELGWRGWTLDDGTVVWVDEGVYDVPYVSHSERRKIDSLTNEEVRSIPAKMREGWRPVMCMTDETGGRVYRIDGRTHGEEEASDSYRLAIYGSREDLRGAPDKLLPGRMEAEGTAATVTYRFRRTEGGEITVEPDASDTGGPVLTMDQDSSIAMKRAYWHELIGHQKH